jgi:hypothetical protein
MRTLSHASSRLPCSSDSMANDVTSAVATPHLFLAGQRTSAVAVGCSAPDTLDLYHECSRETSSGLFLFTCLLSPTLHRRLSSLFYSRNYFLILFFCFFSYFSIFQCRNNQVIYAEARGMTNKTKEPSTSSWLRCTQPLTGTGSTGHLVVFVWLWPPTSHPRPRRWRRPIVNSIRRIITFHLLATVALTAHL